MTSGTAASTDTFSFDYPQNQGYGEHQRLVYLPQSGPNYQMVQRKFLEGWTHTNKRKPHVHAIYKILSSEASLKRYHHYRATVAAHCTKGKNPANVQLLFHGTTRSCSLVVGRNSVRLCGSRGCRLCCVISQSFDIAKCGTRHNFSRFGKGIYTTACSSKADDYTSKRGGADIRVLLVNRVVVGEPNERLQNAVNLTGLPSGYHSLIGNPGIDLNYAETVVYSNDAIRPAYLIVYGDAPPKSTMKPPMSALFNTPLM